MTIVYAALPIPVEALSVPLIPVMFNALHSRDRVDASG
jgi:hypothetical protein